MPKNACNLERSLIQIMTTRAEHNKALPASSTQSAGKTGPADTSTREGYAMQLEPARNYRYTIGTLTNDRDQYVEMLASFKAGGFGDDCCEFTFIDTAATGTTSAYHGLNQLLNNARGDYVILCHHDVRLLHDSRFVLDQRLAALSRDYPNWAVAGNAGGMAPGQLAIRISDPHGENQKTADLPARVSSLDENFLVIRRDARVSFSANLSGYHLYGADICLIADILGYECYVIDFHLSHLSPGKKDPSFATAERAFTKKWSKALRPRWIQTTCALLHISGRPGTQHLSRMVATGYRKIARHLPGAFGWHGAKKRRSEQPS